LAAFIAFMATTASTPWLFAMAVTRLAFIAFIAAFMAFMATTVSMP